MSRIANKRIPVSKEIWETLHGMRAPGQTYSALLQEMISDCQEMRLVRDLDKANAGKFVSIEEAKEMLKK